MSVSIYAHDATGSKRLELANMSSANAAEVLGYLGMTGDDVWCGQMELTKFRNLVANWQKSHFGKLSPEIPTVVEANEGHATFIHCGRDEGYINQRMLQLSRGASAAEREGCTTIFWA